MSNNSTELERDLHRPPTILLSYFLFLVHDGTTEVAAIPFTIFSLQHQINDKTAKMARNSFLSNQSFVKMIKYYGSLKCMCLFLLLNSAPQALAEKKYIVSVELIECTGDTDVFNIDYLSVTCEDYCTWGSEGNVTGAYTLGNYLPTDFPEVTFTVWGMTGFDETVDICDNRTVSNDNGDYCPTNGTYYYYDNLELPGKPETWWAIFLSWFTLRATEHLNFDFGEAVIECKVKIEGGNNGFFSFAFVGSVAVFWVAVVSRRTNRRYIVTDAVKQKESNEEPQTRFVEMIA